MTVVLCSWGDALEGGTEEALTLAGQYSAATGAELTWLVLGGAGAAASELAGRYGVNTLDRIEDPGLAGFGPDALVSALAQYCQQQSPALVLFSQSVQARLIAPRLAGQHTAYLERQYLNFQKGLRGAHPDDRYGRQMKLMAATLPEGKDLDDVLGFIAAQGPAP